MMTDPTRDPRAFLTGLFRTAVDAADPMQIVAPNLPRCPAGRLLVIGAGSVGVDWRRAELGVPHSFLKHVQRNAVHRSVDPEAMPQPFRAAVRCIRYPRLDHDLLCALHFLKGELILRKGLLLAISASIYYVT